MSNTEQYLIVEKDGVQYLQPIKFNTIIATFSKGTRTNAEFVLRAVNNYQSMIEALKEANRQILYCQDLIRMEDWIEVSDVLKEQVKILDTAIQKAQQ